MNDKKNIFTKNEFPKKRSNKILELIFRFLGITCPKCGDLSGYKKKIEYAEAYDFKSSRHRQITIITKKCDKCNFSKKENYI